MELGGVGMALVLPAGTFGGFGTTVKKYRPPVRALPAQAERIDGESPVGVLPLNTRAVSWISSSWLAGTNIFVNAIGKVTEQPFPGADSQAPKKFTLTFWLLVV